MMEQLSIFVSSLKLLCKNRLFDWHWCLLSAACRESTQPKNLQFFPAWHFRFYCNWMDGWMDGSLGSVVFRFFFWACPTTANWFQLCNCHVSSAPPMILLSILRSFFSGFLYRVPGIVSPSCCHMFLCRLLCRLHCWRSSNNRLPSEPWPYNHDNCQGAEIQERAAPIASADCR